MSYDRQYLNLEWIFNVVGTEEVAATGLKITGANTLFPAATVLSLMTTAQGAELIDAYFDIISSSGIRWASYSRLIGIKASAVGTDGHYLTDPRVFTPGSTVQGNQDGVPAQLTVCASIRSGSNFGKANYGRAYLPHTTMLQTDGSPYVAAGVLAAGLTGVQQWLARVNAVAEGIDPGYKVSIMSREGAGTTKVATRVGLDTVIDTQRRRTNRLQHTYSFANFS